MFLAPLYLGGISEYRLFSDYNSCKYRNYDVTITFIILLKDKSDQIYQFIKNIMFYDLKRVCVVSTETYNL